MLRNYGLNNHVYGSMSWDLGPQIAMYLDALGQEPQLVACALAAESACALAVRV